MSSVFSPNKGYQLQGTGDNSGTWGVLLNAIFSTIDLNLGGTLALNVAGNSNINLSSNQQQNGYILMTGILTGSIQVIFTASAGSDFIIDNRSTGAFTITCLPSGGSGVVVPQGTVAYVSIDGTNNRAVLVGPPVTPSSGAVTIASGGTGQVTQTAAFDALSPLTTQGDLLYHNGTHNVRLGPGTAGQALQTQGAGQNPQWATPNPPSTTASFSATKNGVDQLLGANNTLVKVTWPHTDFNVGGFFNTSTSRWTPPAGKILLHAAITADATQDNANTWITAIGKNGVIIKQFYNTYFGNYVSVTSINSGALTVMDQCSGSDYYEVFFQETPGGTPNVVGATTLTWFSGTMI